ncbi:MAG TPA: endonuclease Q family protein [Terriglobia bacterium]|nr:endonuclease Q family protein [Terriglobia bacterium]
MSQYTADLHIHPRSAHSAQRGDCISELIFWAKRKGIQVLGTGDFIYPDWLGFMEAHLEQDECGFLRSKGGDDIRWMLTTEVETVFQNEGRKYQVHLLVTAPSWEIAWHLARVLGRAGDLTAGRIPRFQMPASELLARVLEVCPDSLIIPLHIWSPWGSLYGSRFGFESFVNCFGDLSPQVLAVETGLSSDPGVCWLVSELDGKQIVSFSDAHSPRDIGRECTIFQGECSYRGVCQALQGSGENSIAGTIEFFSEIGRDYFNGHRDCGVIKSPVETRLEGKRCPACRDEITIGALQRGLEIADREVKDLGVFQEKGWIHTQKLRRPPYRKAIPLREIIASTCGIKGKESVIVDRIYEAALGCGATEYQILLEMSESDLKSFVDPQVSEGIVRVRESRLKVVPGFDGVYGSIELFEEKELADLTQLRLFG